MKYSEIELSALGEIGNFAIGGAASSLSRFVNLPITISIPDLKFEPFGKIKEKFGQSVVVARIDFCEGFEGSSIIILSKEEAIKFAKLIIKEKLEIDVSDWGDETESALKEAFNIMAGNMSYALSEIFKKTIKILPPEVYEQDAKEIRFYPENEVLTGIWFRMKISNEITIKIVELFTKEKTNEMIELIRGEYELHEDH